MATHEPANPFLVQFRGNFTSLLSWDELTQFWQVLGAKAAAGWYIYAIGDSVPGKPHTQAEVNKFILEIDQLLRQEHDEDYCGIVYTDSKTDPTFIKIYDPNNLGVSCGSSKNPPLPGWILSLLPPQQLDSAYPLPGGRKRWWRQLWSAVRP